MCNSNDNIDRLKIYEQYGYTLELITPLTPVGPYIFKSLGIQNLDAGSSKDIQYFDGNDFPIGNKYQLMGGTFPLTDYKDLFRKSKKYHHLYIIEEDVVKKKDITVKLLGFNCKSCKEEQNHEFDPCQIRVEKVIEKPTVGGRKKSILKNKSNRKKSNRKKSNRRR